MEHATSLAGHATLQRRRLLAARRAEREERRNETVQACVTARLEATRLSDWIEWAEGRTRGEPETDRLLQWARERVARLEAAASPSAATLAGSDLFPETDDLHDPLGDPAPRHPWGR